MPYIPALQYAMRGCLQKATAMSPNAILFLLHRGTKSQNYGLVSPSCVSLSRVAFQVESEKHAVSSPPLKVPVPHRRKSSLLSSFPKHSFCDGAKNV